FTGASNANYVTDTTQLTDGASFATSADWGGVANRPLSLNALNSTDGTRLSGIEEGATVGGIFPDSAGNGGNLTNVPAAVRDGRVETALNTSGNLKSGIKIVQDDGVPRSIPSGLGFIAVQDGDQVTFDTPYDAVPEVEITGGSALTFSTNANLIGVEQSNDFRAIDVSKTGFTVRAKITSTTTGTIAQSDALNTAGAGGDPDRIGQKGVADNSVDGSYSFEISDSVTFPTSGFFQAVDLKLSIFIDTGSGFVVRSETIHTIVTGASGGLVPVDLSISVGSSISGQHASEEWGYSIEVLPGPSGATFSYESATVNYHSAASPTETSATPDVQSLKAFVCRNQ
ncbi:MAG: hypothetical protein JKX72_04850, partial [Robiginitomaculum sp.]|nr:hypothetical protein [Robiginitomaculum sp.]